MQSKNNNSSAFLPNSVSFLMMSHHLEFCNFICSDCGLVADSHLTSSYCSQNSKLEREKKMIELLDNAVILSLIFFHRV